MLHDSANKHCLLNIRVIGLKEKSETPDLVKEVQRIIKETLGVELMDDAGGAGEEETLHSGQKEAA